MSESDPTPERDAADGLRRRAGIPGATTEPPSRPAIAAVIKTLIRAAGVMPLPLLHALGSAGGRLLGAARSNERRITEVNLELAFPDWPEARRRELLRTSLRETGKAFAETGAIWRGTALAHVRGTTGEECLSEAVEAGGGVLLAAPHLGAWELVGHYCSARYPMTSLYRPMRIREIDDFVRRARERHGARLVATDRTGVRASIAALRRGEIVGIMPDQDPGEGAGVFVPFFGVLANTMILFPKLAARAGVRIVLAYAERLPRAAGYRLHFERASEEAHDRDPAIAARAVNRDIERLVMRHPEQYLWSYRRYRIRPTDEPDPYRKRK